MTPVCINSTITDPLQANAPVSAKPRDAFDHQDTRATTSGLSDPITATAFLPNSAALHNSQTSQANPINPAMFPATQGDSLFESPQSAFYQTPGSNSASDIGNMHDFSQADFQYLFGAQGGNDQFMGDYSGMSTANAGQSFGRGAYNQQPFVPQELWNAPMTFDWDWADLGNMGHLNM